MSALRYRTLTAVLIAVGGFGLSWYLIHHGWFTRAQLIDTPIYAGYAQKMKEGLIPYRDFAEVYPPLALPVFLIPGLIAGRYFSGFTEVFQVGMLIFGLVSVGLAALILACQRVGVRRLAAGVALGGLMPLLAGSVILSRYDLWPTVLTVIALVTLYFGWPKTGCTFLGLGFAAKAYPVVILPIALIYIWRTAGRRQALLGLASFVAVVLVCFLPFVIASPHGVWASFTYQSDRPLQIESLGASIWLAAHQLIGTHLSLYFTHGSDNLNGHPPMEFASVMSVLQAVSIIAVWLVFAAGDATRQRLLASAAATVVAFIIMDRVLSPQYLIWLAPLVVMVPGRRGLVATGLMALAMGLTQIWFPVNWVALKHFEPLESWAVIARNLVLLVLLGTLAWPDAPVWRYVKGEIGRLRGGARIATVPRLDEA